MARVLLRQDCDPNGNGTGMLESVRSYSSWKIQRLGGETKLQESKNKHVVATDRI